MKKIFNILLLITQMEPAGAQKAMLTLAHGLKERGHEVKVVTMYDKTGCVDDFKEIYDVPIVNLEMKTEKSGGIVNKINHFLSGVLKLFKILNRRSYDIVQTFSHYSNIIGPVIAWLAGVRVRISSQRSSLKGASKWLLWLDRVITNSFLVDKMVAVSKGTRQFSIDEEGINPDKLITIHNSIDLNRFSPSIINQEELVKIKQDLELSESSHIVITVARLHPQKGHRYLIDAIPQIIGRYPVCHFLFVGDGELKQDLISHVNCLNLESHVHFLGLRNDIPELLALSDVFLLPSLWEGLPNTILEAMAMQVPVIATNVDGCPEIIKDKNNGFLIPPKDPTAIAETVNKLLDNPRLRESIAQNAHVWVREEFSPETNFDSFEQLYLKIFDAKNHCCT